MAGAGPGESALRPPAYLGLDLGTSGCRVIAIDDAGEIITEHRTALPASHRPRPGWSEQDPEDWLQAVTRLLAATAGDLTKHRPVALAIDGTSGTLLGLDDQGRPMTPALMYDDARAKDQLDRLQELAPDSAPVHGASSSLAKLLWWLANGFEPVRIAHQCDWILHQLGADPVMDEHNALKLGYDPLGRTWPEWLEKLIETLARRDAPRFPTLPKIVEVGSPIGHLSTEMANRTGLPSSLRLLAGTTDSTAGVLATGAKQIGDAVTSLGSTLVVKLLSDRPIFAPELGVYSHRIGPTWLAGGASNSGGAVLRHFFSDDDLAILSSRIDPERDGNLDYYPLLRPGERFPFNDPHLPPRLAPRPADATEFLQGLLEGMAEIERLAFARLRELGATWPKRVLTVGGGAQNPRWTRLRERKLGVPVLTARQQEAAYGMACLAKSTCHGTA